MSGSARRGQEVRYTWSSGVKDLDRATLLTGGERTLRSREAGTGPSVV